MGEGGERERDCEGERERIEGDLPRITGSGGGGEGEGLRDL